MDNKDLGRRLTAEPAGGSSTPSPAVSALPGAHQAQWTWEEHQLSEGFSCIVYDEHGRRVADHLDRATAAKISAVPELVEAMEGIAHFGDAVAYRSDPLAVALRQWIAAGEAALNKALGQ